MRQILTYILILSTWYLWAQTAQEPVKEQVDTIAINSQKWVEIQSICAELRIPANPEANLNLLIFILDWKGTPYCYGGSSKQCTDCSGFTSNAYSDVYKKTIPRVSRDIYSNSIPIKKFALYEGDLVFFATAGDTRITHVGIYLWDGYFAHASSSKGVTISNLRQGFYKRTFISGGAWID